MDRVVFGDGATLVMALAQSEKATEDERHARYAAPEALAVHVQACICVATHDKPNIVRIQWAADGERG
eukprot:CAMPEP_0183564652 /NCGR_PEP_ID=MMETSP0371-20130417/106159_1 /TAXON_ID=268820 /ORGANISM="Peridinium aciculiferum, Strain PAER-2" /LENGTH=67 /DNA_ID=CAMNT_0025773703 /DNA_START=50 /DNA_END=249 /DNA_ORIENTATION=+